MRAFSRAITAEKLGAGALRFMALSMPSLMAGWEYQILDYFGLGAITSISSSETRRMDNGAGSSENQACTTPAAGRQAGAFHTDRFRIGSYPARPR